MGVDMSGCNDWAKWVKPKRCKTGTKVCKNLYFFV